MYHARVEVVKYDIYTSLSTKKILRVRTRTYANDTKMQIKQRIKSFL